MSLLRRRMMMSNKPNGGENSIFPMYLNLEKVSSSKYRLDPTPESIALCDYLNENLVFDGSMNWGINFEPGQLFIDGLEVQSLSVEGDAQSKFDLAWWYPYHSRYDEWEYLMFGIYLDDTYGPKGTLIAYNDN